MYLTILAQRIKELVGVLAETNIIFDETGIALHSDFLYKGSIVVFD